MPDNTYQIARCYSRQDGVFVVPSGASIEVETGGDLKHNGTSLIDELAALSGLDSGELGVLNGVTAGTVTASKALVADANKDLSAMRTVGVVNLDAGSSGVAGSVDVFPTTAAKGKLSFTCADQAGDTTVTVTTAAMAAARTLTIPDPGVGGSSFVMSEGVQTVNGGKTFGSALGTAANVGVAATDCTVTHRGDGTHVTATVTVTDAVLTVGSSENLGTGVLLYTLPAGACLINAAYMSLAIAGVSTTTDTPDVGLGTVVASGAVVTLDGTGTFENIITGQAAADTNGTPTVKAAGPTAGNPLEITTGGAHTVYFNAADGWGANADAAGTVNGTVVLDYTFLAA